MTQDFDTRQRDRLVQAFTVFVNGMAAKIKRTKHLPFYIDVEDLAQAGMIGLLDGLSKCDWGATTRSR